MQSCIVQFTYPWWSKHPEETKGVKETVKVLLEKKIKKINPDFGV